MTAAKNQKLGRVSRQVYWVLYAYWLDINSPTTTNLATSPKRFLKGIQMGTYYSWCTFQARRCPSLQRLPQIVVPKVQRQHHYWAEHAYIRESPSHPLQPRSLCVADWWGLVRCWECKCSSSPLLAALGLDVQEGFKKADMPPYLADFGRP